MGIQTKYNFGDIVYFTEYTKVYEARVVGVEITEDIPNEPLYKLDKCDYNKSRIYESYLFTSAENAKQAIIDSIEVLNL